MININMIAERRARKIREMTILRVSTLVVFCLTVLMVLWNVAAGLVQLSAKNDVEAINDELRKQKPLFEEWQHVQSEIAERQPVVTLLDQVQKSEGAWMIMLADLSRIIPGNVVITGMGSNNENDGVSLHIEGIAKDEDAVAEFMLAINERTTWAGKAVLKGTTSRGTGEKVSKQFNITVPVRGLVGGDL